MKTYTYAEMMRQWLSEQHTPHPQAQIVENYYRVRTSNNTGPVIVVPETEWVVAPEAPAAIAAAEQRARQNVREVLADPDVQGMIEEQRRRVRLRKIEADLRAKIKAMADAASAAREAAATPKHPLVSAIDIMHRSARRMPHQWPEF